RRVRARGAVRGERRGLVGRLLAQRRRDAGPAVNPPRWPNQEYTAMRKIMLAAALLLAVGCGNQGGPAQVTPELEAEQRDDEARVHKAERERQRNPTIGDQEVEGRQRTEEERVHDAESAWQKQQPMPQK